MKIISKTLRILNYKHKRLGISRFLRLPYVLDYPMSASIETTNLCNLKCHVCEGRTISSRNKGNMKYEDFQKILDELGPHLYDLELSGWGEPFINKDIYKMFNYARERAPKAYIYTDTNGHFIDNDMLFNSPPDELVFSIDGIDQETYEKYRVNGELNKVLNNLRNCIETKRKLQIDKPKIVVKFISMKHNEHQLDSIPDFTRQIGADDYRIELFTSRSVKHAREFMSTISRYQKYDAEQLNKGCLVPYMKQLTTPCSMLWTSANIYWNGDVSPCCLDYDSKYSWGNIFKEGGFWQVWNGKKARGFRFLHHTPAYRSDISICKNCFLTNCVLDEDKKETLSLEKAGRSYQ